MITDGSFYCGRCGEDRVHCHLCLDLEPMLIERRASNISIDDEDELRLQEYTIQYAASKRQGF